MKKRVLAAAIAAMCFVGTVPVSAVPITGVAENLQEQTVLTENDDAIYGIGISKAPDKTTYKIGEQLDLSGLRLNGSYRKGELISTIIDEDYQDLLNSNVPIKIDASEFDNTKAGRYHIYVVYGNTKTSFTVTVYDDAINTTIAVTGTNTVTTTTTPVVDDPSLITSVATVKIMDISGDVILVKPVDGSWELKSADKFTLSAKQLPADITPKTGMKLEITYNGGILETYPAQFGNVQKIVAVKDDTLKNDGILLKGTKDMTLNDVMRLAEKGNDLDWSDFKDYNGRDVGSGLHIWEYKLEDGYVLDVGGDIQKKPIYILLSHNNDKSIDIRTDDVEKYLSTSSTTAEPVDFSKIPLEGTYSLKLNVMDIVRNVKIAGLDCELFNLQSNEVVAKWNTSETEEMYIENLKYSFDKPDSYNGNITYAIRITNLPENYRFFYGKTRDQYGVSGFGLEEFANGTDLSCTVYLEDTSDDAPKYTYVTTVQGNIKTTTTTTTAIDYTIKDIAVFTEGETMTFDDVIELSKKGNALTLNDFAKFKGVIAGSGIFILEYDLGNGYTLMVGSVELDKIAYARLRYSGSENDIDIRTDDVKEYIASSATPVLENSDYSFDDILNMSAEELEKLFLEKGLTESNGVETWTTIMTKEQTEYYLRNGMLSVNIDPVKYMKIIKESNENKTEVKSADDIYMLFEDGPVEWDIDKIYSSLGLSPEQFDIKARASMTWFTKNEQDETVFRKYCQCIIKPVSDNRDEFITMFTAMLNYVQLNPDYVNRFFDSIGGGMLPAEIIKGDANCDSQVDLSDAVMIMQALANPNKYGLDGTAEHHLTEQGKLNGDMNGDGLTVGDAQAIQRKLLGLSDTNIDKSAIAGKIFAYEKEGAGGYCTLSFNENGRFIYSPGKLSSYMGGGDWKIDGDTVSLIGMVDKTIYLKITDDALVYIAEGSDEFPYMDIKDGEKFGIYRPEISSDYFQLNSRYSEYGLGNPKVELNLMASELPEFCYVENVKLYDEDNNFIGMMSPAMDANIWGYLVDCNVTEECSKTYYTLTKIRCGEKTYLDDVRSEITVNFKGTPAP